jgi:hypothetical protein
MLDLNRNDWLDKRCSLLRCRMNYGPKCSTVQVTDVIRVFPEYSIKNLSSQLQMCICNTCQIILPYIDAHKHFANKGTLFGAATISVMTLSITAISIMANQSASSFLTSNNSLIFSVMSLSVMTIHILGITALSTSLCHAERHYGVIVMLSDTITLSILSLIGIILLGILSCNAGCRFAEWHNDTPLMSLSIITLSILG